jgi:hypothetical protein
MLGHWGLTSHAADELQKELRSLLLRAVNADGHSMTLTGLGCRTGSTMPIDVPDSGSMPPLDDAWLPSSHTTSSDSIIGPD